MKKITLLLFVSFVSYFAYAAGDWATCAVSVTKDSDPAYLYKLNDAGWTDGTWQSNTAFDAFDFGTPTTLTLNGGAGNAWADGGDYYDATSFKIYYRVYKTGNTPGSWMSIDLTNQAYQNGNNYIYDKGDAAVDVLALATVSGTNTYTFEVVMTKDQFYTGGDWKSMIPGGQGTAYDSNAAGYKATFTHTYVPTGLSKLESSLKLSGSNGMITARFDGDAKVELYSATGQLIRSANANGEFSENVKSGLYLVRLNGVTHKVMVK